MFKGIPVDKNGMFNYKAFVTVLKHGEVDANDTVAAAA